MGAAATLICPHCRSAPAGRDRQSKRSSIIGTLTTVYAFPTLDELRSELLPRFEEVSLHIPDSRDGSEMSDCRVSGSPQSGSRMSAAAPLLLPVTSLQRSMVLASLGASRDGVYLVQDVCELSGTFDVALLRRAWRAVIRRHPVIGCAVCIRDGKPVGFHLDEQAASTGGKRTVPTCPPRSGGAAWTISSVRTASEASISRPALRCGSPSSEAPTTRSRSSGPCTTRCSTAARLRWSGRSGSPFMTRFCRAATPGHRTTGGTRSACAGSDYRCRSGAVLAGLSARLVEHHRLHRRTHPARCRRRRRAGRAGASRVVGRSDPTTAGARRCYTASALNNVVQGAWALLLSRYSGRSDVVFGVTRSGRTSSPDDACKVGFYINTLPLRVEVESAGNARALAERGATPLAGPARR